MGHAARCRLDDKRGTTPFKKSDDL